ncbi:substrate-binding domain-containing protein [Lentzea sp. CA-135723]|uniref:vWA domain-containing protein n=1 Tax=Lentzea sp. CA-135723 TaxID=3239950 RepID=UPI003D8B053E
MKRLLSCAVVVLLVLTGAGCFGGDSSVRVRVLASPELRDLEPLLEELREERGIRVELDYRPTVDLGDTLAEGTGGHDFAWPSSDGYLKLLLRDRKPPRNLPPSTPIMTSPVVIGVTAEVGRKLAARAQTPTWATVADLAATGDLRFAMGDPVHSGTGLAALVGVATAAAGTGQALRADDVRCDRLSGFWQGHAVATDSSAAAAGQFVQPGPLNGLIATESVLLKLNASGTLPEPLQIVYPADGIVLADHPLLLLNDKQRTTYDTVVEWLRTERAQRWIMDKTARRPVNPDVPRSERLARPVGTALYYPDDLSVVRKLQENYRKQGTPDLSHRYVVFVLDYSGSMREQIDALRSAFRELTSPSTGSFVRFYLGERIRVIRFADQVLEQRDFTFPGDTAELEKTIGATDFGENTAIWSAVDTAYAAGADLRRSAPGSQVSVVLMTDGRNNNGMSATDFLAAQRTRGTVGPLLAIRFGDADPAELSRVAGDTGGSVVDATGRSLADAFKETRGCF